MLSLADKLGIYANSAVDVAYRKGPFSPRPEVTKSDPQRLYDVLDSYDDETVFTHVGLSAIRDAFDADPYHFLREVLDERFESVLAPGYTPQFRETGEYDKRNSEPAYGTWSKLFFQDAEYRTDDAIHSILVRGPYRFDDCDHHDTFAEDGCFGQLDRDDVLVLNVGTPWLFTTQHHYIERQFGVPYQSYPVHEGVIVDEGGNEEEIAQRNDTYCLYARRAARKIQRQAVAAGVVDEFEIGGVLVLLFRAGAYHDFVRRKLSEDPCYLVKMW
jgi:aminoglycoside N3'-acetyltransferase